MIRSFSCPNPQPFANCQVSGVAPPQVAVGVDVGEDFLDLAVLRTASRDLRFHRIGLAGIDDAPLEILRERLRECCPDANPGWLALVDSPRWPRDLNYSGPALTRRNPIPRARMLDSALRQMLRASADHAAMRLAMFPTPVLAYFSRCACIPNCKPHLRSIYHALFTTSANSAREHGTGVESLSGGGGNFTRFMLAGFLVFRAWEALGVSALEAYPDLQFRLCAGRSLLPKRAGKAALAQRVAINLDLRKIAGIKRSSLPANLDQADAEVLASSAIAAGVKGSLAALEHPAEGRFLLTFSV
jgi:hypothetical protein